MIIQPPLHIVWSTDRVDPNDPFQKRWLLRQTLMYGKAEDIRALKLADIQQELDQLGLPKEIESLWWHYLEYCDAKNAGIESL